MPPVLVPSHLPVGVKPQEHSEITTDRVIEIVGDQGERPETDFLLGSKRRISPEAGKPLLIIFFATELVSQCPIPAGHPDGQLSAETQLPDYLLTRTIQQPRPSPAPPGRMDAHVKSV